MSTSEQKAPTLESIHAPKIFEHIAGLRNGLVVIGGSTGSGCSVSLAAILNHINQNQQMKVSVIEESPEFHYDEALSTIVRHSIPLNKESVDAIWVDALMENPDVIVVDSKRGEDIKRAIQAASHNRLVLLSAHSQCSVIDTLNRIIHTFADDEKVSMLNLLADTLRVVVAQTILPPAQGNGCVVAHEILTMDTQARGILARNNLSGLNNYLQIQDGLWGMQTLEYSLNKLVKSDHISLLTMRMQQQFIHERCLAAV